MTFFSRDFNKVSTKTLSESTRGCGPQALVGTPTTCVFDTKTFDFLNNRWSFALQKEGSTVCAGAGGISLNLWLFGKCKLLAFIIWFSLKICHITGYSIMKNGIDVGRAYGKSNERLRYNVSEIESSLLRHTLTQPQVTFTHLHLHNLARLLAAHWLSNSAKF